MKSDIVLSQIRRKKRSAWLLTWFAQAVIAIFRVFLPLLNFVGPPQRRHRARELEEKMQGIRHGRDQMLHQIQDGKIWEALEAADELMLRHSHPDEREAIREEQAKRRALRQESDDLQQIHRQAEGDNSVTIEGFRNYITAHPNSHFAYSYLGGALQKASDFDGSLAAYQQAVDLAGKDTVSGSSARLSIGDVLQKKGNLQEAIQVFREIIDEASPQTETTVCLAYLHLGNTLNDTGDRSGARGAWKESIKWDSTGLIAKKAKQMLRTT